MDVGRRGVSAFVGARFGKAPVLRSPTLQVSGEGPWADLCSLWRFSSHTRVSTILGPPTTFIEPSDAA